jgi:hypothetical protein
VIETFVVASRSCPRIRGIPGQVISNSLAGRQLLTGEQALSLAEFLKKNDPREN